MFTMYDILLLLISRKNMRRKSTAAATRWRVGIAAGVSCKQKLDPGDWRRWRWKSCTSWVSVRRRMSRSKTFPGSRRCRTFWVMMSLMMITIPMTWIQIMSRCPLTCHPHHHPRHPPHLLLMNMRIFTSIPRNQSALQNFVSIWALLSPIAAAFFFHCGKKKNERKKPCVGVERLMNSFRVKGYRKFGSGWKRQQLLYLCVSLSLTRFPLASLSFTVLCSHCRSSCSLPCCYFSSSSSISSGTGGRKRSIPPFSTPPSLFCCYRCFFPHRTSWTACCTGHWLVEYKRKVQLVHLWQHELDRVYSTGKE